MHELPENITLAKAFSKDLPKHQASYIQELEAKTEHLQAENAQLKAHNRQLVEAISDPPDGVEYYAEVKALDLWRNQALQTPPAKLAMAEAEVLRAAEEWVKGSPFDAVKNRIAVREAVDAMQEARKDV